MASILTVIKHIKNWPIYILDGFHVIKPKFILYKLRNGVKYKVRAHTVDREIIDEIWIREDYTPRGFHIGESDIIVDIGAHIGIFSIFASNKAKSGEIHSYEPNPDNYALLADNVSINNLKNVHINNYAVSNEEGSLKLYVTENTGGHTINPKTPLNDDFIEVNSVTLERIFADNNLTKINFLKMDCEGGEYEIFLKCSDKLLQKIDKISMEYHNLDVKRNVKSIEEHLKKNGFNVDVHPIPNSDPEVGMLFASRV